MTLYAKISRTLSLLIILLIIGVVLFMTIQWFSTLRRQLGREAFDMALTIAQTELVREHVPKENGYIAIQNFIEKLRLKTRIQYIYVLNRDKRFYSNPKPALIGETFSSTLVDVVLKEEKARIVFPSFFATYAEAVAPVYSEGVLSGAVVVGMLNGRIYQEITRNLIFLLIFMFFIMMCGVLVSFALTSSIKRSIRGLEPEEISFLLGQKELVLQNLKEGLVVVDEHFCISMYNKSAETLLDLSPSDIGKNYKDYFFASGLTEAFERHTMLVQEVRQGPLKILLGKYYPVSDSATGAFLGLMASFEDLTVARQRAEELTGMKELTQALRAQNHEFMNKLHTISGMIQLGEIDTAVTYISGITKKRQEILSLLSSSIKLPALAGLILSKYNKAAEARVSLQLDPHSSIHTLPEGMRVESLVSVIGNLIENALDALIPAKNGRIDVRLIEDESNLEITVSDNGPGICPGIENSILCKGFTTKEEGRGYGLYVVSKIVEEERGSIEIDTNQWGGAEFVVTFPIKRAGAEST
ncbi:sensor histidine kinase [Sediminispirochaeta bajacaliforniensis]|uniref:sensor histidine kinase n=1 Tax=Sediminispirochaeta bajacaliforniensis TaxID=148 RepID=UPI000367709D|nr:sensor histidine kinase [Sediminispirochaeta bajacaliforniensis]